MAKNGNHLLGLSSQGPIHPKVWAVATELNNRLAYLKKKTGSAERIAGLTALDLRWITKFLETGDVYEATRYAYKNRKLNPVMVSHMANDKQNKPMIVRTIQEIMKEEEKFSDDKILDRAATLYYNSDNESTATTMFGHLARIKGWNAPEKAVNVNINKDLGSSSDAELLETLDTVIAGETGTIRGESDGDNEDRTGEPDEPAAGDGTETGKN